MKTLSAFFTLFILLSCSENKQTHVPISFELRLAETEPNSNLTEMTMHNSDFKFFVGDSTFLINRNIKSAEVFDRDTHPKVMVTLNDDGRKKFSTFTQQHIGKNAAILVDGKLVSSPKIMAQISEGKLLIVGHFSHEEALKIAKGILP